MERSISIKNLDCSKESIKIVSDLIEKDKSGKTFYNEDEHGNIIPTERLAKLYLEYSDMYVIQYIEQNIGLLAISNCNEISLFIDPNYQNKGLGEYCLRTFEQLLKKEVNALVAETTIDNIEAIRLLEKAGFKKINESRQVSINNVYVKVAKYKKNIQQI